MSTFDDCSLPLVTYSAASVREIVWVALDERVPAVNLRNRRI